MSSDYYGAIAGEIADEGDDDWEPCSHDHHEDCCDQFDELDCSHQHCFNCGGCGCPGYCDDYQTYNLRPAETGGDSGRCAHCQQPLAADKEGTLPQWRDLLFCSNSCAYECQEQAKETPE